MEYATGDINSNKKGSGARANKGKVSLSFVPIHLLAGCARVFMSGAIKYAPYNWAKGMPWSDAFDPLFRHLLKWWYLGENIDPESGEHHLDHILCNLFMLKHYTETYTEGDDRPPQDITRFNDWLGDFNTLFNRDDFLERNPDIKKLIEEREKNDK